MVLETGFTVNGVKAAPSTPKIGTTSGAGNAGGTTLIDAALLTEADDYWNGATVLILSGANLGQSRAITDFANATGTVTVDDAFDAQVASGVKYAILTGDAAAWAKHVLGGDNNDNGFDSSNVAGNADGSVLERLEFIQGVLAGMEPVTFTPSSAPVIDEDGGRQAVHVSIVDRNTGVITAANIDITGATYELAKSTGGGAFSTVGITQPSGATKSDGQVDLEFDFVAAEWAVGDVYRLKVGGVTATVGATTYHMGTLAWIGEVAEDLDVKTAVDDINTDLGEPNDVAMNPSGAVGSLHAKVGGLGQALLSGNFSVNDGAPTDTTFITNMTEATDDHHKGDIIHFVTGTLASQSRRILAYNGTTKALTVAIPFTEAPGNADQFYLIAAGADTLVPAVDDTGNNTVAQVVGNKSDAGSAAATASVVALTRLLVDIYAGTTGTADGGSTTTLVDAALTQADADYWTGMMLVMLSGGAAGQARAILDFNPATDTVTVAPAFTQAVAATDEYAIVSYDAGQAFSIALTNANLALASESIGHRIARAWCVDPDPVTAASDASVGSTAEENLLDVGADAGTSAYRLDSALCRVISMGANATITFRVKAEVNGTLQQIGNDVDRTGTGVFDLLSVLGVAGSIAARHVRVTVVGDNAADDGSVEATFVTSRAGVA